jgi:uncharacterized membrane protein
LNWWDRLLWEIGYAICHQLPERTIRFGSNFLFVCARDTGLFVGFFLVALLILLLPRGREQGGLPPHFLKALILLALLFLLWDTVTSYLGWRESNNTIRLISGLLAGSGLALVTIPLHNRLSFHAPRRNRVAREGAQLALISLVLALALGLFLWHPPSLFRVGQILTAISVIGTLGLLNHVLCLSLVRGKKPVAIKYLHIVILMVVPLLVAGELFLSHRLHSLLNR